MTSDRTSETRIRFGRQGATSVATYFFFSFVLHLVWENVQAPLYAGFESFGQHFLPCLFATATGDMIFTLVIYIAIASALRDPQWLSDPSSYRHTAPWILSLLLGALLSVSYELWAIYTEERWQYGDMPLIPIVRVGLTPVLQMLIIPLIAFGATIALSAKAAGPNSKG